MLYTTGDVISAVRLFLGLLRGSIFVAGVPTDTDRVCLEDFRIAYEVGKAKFSSSYIHD